MLDENKIQVDMIVKSNSKARVHRIPIDTYFKIISISEHRNYIGIDLSFLGNNAPYYYDTKIVSGKQPNWGLGLFDHTDKQNSLDYANFSWGEFK